MFKFDVRWFLSLTVGYPNVVSFLITETTILTLAE